MLSSQSWAAILNVVQIRCEAHPSLWETSNFAFAMGEGALAANSTQGVSRHVTSPCHRPGRYWSAKVPDMPALAQLVAKRVGAWSAGYIKTNAALHKIRLIWIAKENERRAVIERLAVSGNLPAGLQQFLNGGFVISCRRNGC